MLSWVEHKKVLEGKKRIYVFGVTRLYLNLLVKPRIFSGFLEI